MWCIRDTIVGSLNVILQRCFPLRQLVSISDCETTLECLVHYETTGRTLETSMVEKNMGTHTAYNIIAMYPDIGTRYDRRVYVKSANAPCADGYQAPPPTP